MRQSNKCERGRNDEIFNLHLGSGAGSCGISFLLRKKVCIKIVLEKRKKFKKL